MVSKVFGGLSFSAEERLICAKMASAAHRWPFVKLKTGIFDGSWFGETLPGYGEPHWYVNETNELIYGKRDTIQDSKGPFDPSSFAIEIIFRPQTGEIELWSGIGATPLFYAFDAANLIIGSDPTVVCAALKSSPELDPAGIMSLFALEYQTPARSLFKEVKRVPPLHRIKGGAEGWSEPISYVKPIVSSFPQAGSTNISDAAECLIRAVADAVRNREGVCLPLTGGADSRTILASTPSCERLQAYTRGTPRDAEVVTATKLAKIVGIPHRCFPFPDDYLEKSFPRVVHLTGGCVPANHSHAIHPLGQLAKQTVDTVLPGTNGGFGRSFRATEHFAGTSGATDFWNRFFALNFKFDEQTMTNLFHPPWSDAVLSTIPDLRHEYAADLPVNGTTPQVDLDWIHLLRRIPHFTVWGPYVWNSAFQVVMPFMNFDYLKAVAGLPSGQRSSPAVHASVIKSRNPRFLKIPLVPSGRMLKPKIGERWRARWHLRKASLMGISQLGPQRYDLWLRKEAAFVESVLFSSHAADRRLFRIEETRKLWHEHLGGGNQTALLCKLLTLELACRINVDGMSVNWNESNGHPQ